MKTFTINSDNNITVHTSRKAARDTGAPVFASEEQFADLIGPDNKRLVEIWNSLPGVTPVTKFANRKVATERIWKAVQALGEVAVPPDPEPEVHESEAETALRGEIVSVAVMARDTSEVVEPAANVGALAPQGAPAKAKSSRKATPVKKAPKAKKGAKVRETAGPREGSKAEQVIAMLKRKNGATLAEIMEKMGWQKHTVRGFMAGAMKKAGYTVESFKSDKGERTYRINQ
jgi:Protein of unknown function (DUF3489)